MSKGELKEKLELVTNIIVIVGVLALGGGFFWLYTNQAKSVPEAPAVGTVLPALPGYNWDGHTQSLLLALRKGCHFCEDSMPFYRELLKAEKSGGSKAHVVAVLPDTVIDATRVVQDAQLDVPMVAPFQLQRLHVSGTPTVILVDGKGMVEKVWVGEQDAAGQQGIRTAIQR